MIYRAIEQANARRVAIVGIAKHAGKTTAMNSLISQASAAGRRVGLVSIGVDGERRDAIMGVPKPEVYVPVGALVASAGDVLQAGSAVLSVVGRTGFSSTLGDVYLARVERAGTVLLAGVRYASQVQAVLRQMEELGAELCLVDGAFDRMMAASPSLTDGVVLATGAVVASTVEEVARKSVYFVQRFSLPEADAAVGQLLVEAQTEGAVVVGCWQEASTAADGSQVSGWQAVHLQQTSTFTANPLTDPAWPATANPRVLALTGAVTDRLLGMLEGLPRGFTVLMPDVTHFFATAHAWRKFLRRGHQVVVHRPVRLLGLAVNPHSVAGYDLPRHALVQAVREQVGDLLPIEDVQGEER